MKRALLFLFLLLSVAAARAQFGGPAQVTPSLVAETTAIAPGKPFTVGVRLKIDAGWHIYWQHSGETGAAPKVEWELPPGFTAGELQWPLPSLHFQDDFYSNIYEGEVLLLAEIKPPGKLPAGGAKLRAKVSWFVCSTTCVPGNGEVELTLPTIGEVGPANAELFATWRARLPSTEAAPGVKWEAAADQKSARVTVRDLPAGTKLECFPLPPAVGPTDHATAKEADGVWTIEIPTRTSGTYQALLVAEKDGVRRGWYISPKGVGEQPPAETRSLWSVLVLAFLGGLVLNIMPCVLPVIALKIFGFVRQAGEDPKRVVRLGLVFAAGVFTFFLGLAVIASILHASGGALNWGAQFQNPFLRTGVIALTFVLGLNLLGVFEITLSGGATSALSELSGREGYGGAFLHGLFTTLLGTSCTAPFLGVSLGYAVTQSTPVIILLFLTVALGMSLPYVLLTAFPAWMKFLPKPGMWMERFKQFTGFVMLGVVVWLLSGFMTDRPVAAANLSWYLLLLAVGCWWMGASQARWVRWLVFPLIAVAGYTGIVHGSLKAPLAGGGSQLSKRVAEARQTGQPVFVDFTASWCANCKTYERFVLHTKEVQAAFDERKVITVIADWSNPDAEIEEWLRRFQRSGVPLYLLYKPGEEQPVVMDTLAKGSFLELLATLPKPVAATAQR